ncbi:hypothetical protein AB6A40_001903 [Gnathostoma spinigerum]|uniref:Uncharacterized protein n=1 Tax=Gnathostoma spinigerum TaxID=75299 RepID=A0ABD6E5A8_9BILA
MEGSSVTAEDDLSSLPGPLGVKYDDSLSTLVIHLVVMGMKGKTFHRASNTDIHLKYDRRRLSILMELFKLNKKAKPPRKTVFDRRYFEMKEAPGEISFCEYKIKKDQCILIIHKTQPGLWTNALSS